jgi:hypothetical protein
VAESEYMFMRLAASLATTEELREMLDDSIKLSPAEYAAIDDELNERYDDREE